MLLMQAASQGQGTMAEATLMRQLARLTVAIIDMHKAAADVDERAAESVRTAQTGLSAPRPGSPLPTRIEPAKPYKPATGPDHDRGIGR